MDETAVRETLTAERAAVLARLRAMALDFDDIVADSQHANGDDEHDPEGSTIAYERAQVSALIAEAQSSLDAVDQAFARLSAGCYSKCEGCGGPISPERQRALPTCRTCIECAASRRPS
jgi:DnaK suppressor protein